MKTKIKAFCKLTASFFMVIVRNTQAFDGFAQIPLSSLEYVCDILGKMKNEIMGLTALAGSWRPEGLIPPQDT